MVSSYFYSKDNRAGSRMLCFLLMGQNSTAVAEKYSIKKEFKAGFH